VLIAPLLMQCASTYHPIDPPTVEYTVHDENDDVDFSYRYDVLTYRGNRKYPKKEKRYGFNIVAAEITNKTPRTLNFVRDLELYTQRGTVFAAENEYTAKTIHQPVAIYLLYGLLYYTSFECSGNDCHVTSFIPFGLGIAAGNMIVAGAANAKMKEEFNAYSPHAKNIGPNETVHVILAIRDMGFAPLKMRVREKPAGD
jgi:hypothetical protein